MADTVCWALYELARCPEHQQTVRAEVMETMNSVRVREEQSITHADLERMSFTLAFMKVCLFIFIFIFN